MHGTSACLRPQHTVDLTAHAPTRAAGALVSSASAPSGTAAIPSMQGGGRRPPLPLAALPGPGSGAELSRAIQAEADANHERRALRTEHGTLGLPPGAELAASTSTSALQQKGAGTRAAGRQGAGRHVGGPKGAEQPPPVLQQGSSSERGHAAPGYKRHSIKLKSALDLEAEVRRDYVQKQRATMTAPHVFTWGGRFRWQGPKHATGMQHTVRSGLRREPLNLDNHADD